MVLKDQLLKRFSLTDNSLHKRKQEDETAIENFDLAMASKIIHSNNSVFHDKGSNKVNDQLLQ